MTSLIKTTSPYKMTPTILTKTQQKAMKLMISFMTKQKKLNQKSKSHPLKNPSLLLIRITFCHVVHCHYLIRTCSSAALTGKRSKILKTKSILKQNN